MYAMTARSLTSMRWRARIWWQGLEGREAVTVVVDDSHSVWSGHRRNLVMVERYVYFPSSRLQLGINRPSLLEANRCELQTHGMPRSRVLHSCPRAACGWLAAGKEKVGHVHRVSVQQAVTPSLGPNSPPAAILLMCGRVDHTPT